MNEYDLHMVSHQPAARSIWMCLTRRCNFACGYCYQGSHARVLDGLAQYMTTETAGLALEWSHEWGKGPLTVCWYGGEPLLAFERVMEWAVPHWVEERAARGLPPARHSVTTNGSLLSDRVRRWMDQHHVGLLLSLDGPQRFHDRSRPYYDGRGTWASIPVRELLAWRPELEIAWQLDPKFFDPGSGEQQVGPDTLDEMMSLGFHNINFNVNWMAEWSEVARWNLFWFFKHVTILMVQRQRDLDAGKKPAGGLSCNWWGKLQRALTVDEKMAQPCGTGLNMVGISPEGWLYPSQEMCYTVFEPGRAPGTAEYYRLGDLREEPVLNVAQLAKLSAIRTEQMRPPAPFRCDTCVAKSASIGGCHCRYVGDYQHGLDVENRFEVTLGYCQSTVAVHLGMLAGASVTRWIRPAGWNGKPHAGSMQVHQKPQPGAEQRIEAALARIEGRLASMDVVRLEEVADGS